MEPQEKTDNKAEQVNTKIPSVIDPTTELATKTQGSVSKISPRNKKIIIALVVIEVLLLILAASYFLIFKNKDSKSNTLNNQTQSSSSLRFASTDIPEIDCSKFESDVSQDIAQSLFIEGKADTGFKCYGKDIEISDERVLFLSVANKDMGSGSIINLVKNKDGKTFSLDTEIYANTNDLTGCGRTRTDANAPRPSDDLKSHDLGLREGQFVKSEGAYGIAVIQKNKKIDDDFGNSCVVSADFTMLGYDLDAAKNEMNGILDQESDKSSSYDTKLLISNMKVEYSLEKEESCNASPDIPNCYVSQAAMRNNESLCELALSKISEDEHKKELLGEECYQMLANKNLDAGFCDKIPDKIRRGARSQEEEKLMHEEINGYTKEQCVNKSMSFKSGITSPIDFTYKTNN